MKKKKLIETVIYTRSSIEDPEVNLGEQVNLCLDYCKKNGLEVVDCIFETSSATSGTRHGIEYLLELIESGSIKAVVVTSADRLVRSHTEALNLSMLLDECGVRLHTISGESLLLEATIEEMKQTHKKMMSTKIKQGIAKSKSQKKVINSSSKKK